MHDKQNTSAQSTMGKIQRHIVENGHYCFLTGWVPIYFVQSVGLF